TRSYSGFLSPASWRDSRSSSSAPCSPMASMDPGWLGWLVWLFLFSCWARFLGHLLPGSEDRTVHGRMLLGVGGLQLAGPPPVPRGRRHPRLLLSHCGPRRRSVAAYVAPSVESPVA